MTPRASRCQPPCSDAWAVRAAERCKRAGASASMRGPSATEHGGEHEQRDRTGRQRHERPADPHRVEEADREDQHRGQAPATVKEL